MHSLIRLLDLEFKNQNFLDILPNHHYLMNQTLKLHQLVNIVNYLNIKHLEIQINLDFRLNFL